MLDSTSLPCLMTDAWQDVLAHGDIVLFRFPLSEGSDDAPIKARPCLVLDIETIGETRYARIAYGTTSRRRSNVGEEIHIRKRDAYTAAGLDRPTRFIGARRVLVPLTHSGFVVRTATGTPVLGWLTGPEIDRLNAVRGRIHALHDIAADRRANQSKRLVTGFTVEHRHATHLDGKTGDAA
jgi:hypothetical protein